MFFPLFALYLKLELCVKGWGESSVFGLHPKGKCKCKLIKKSSLNGKNLLQSGSVRDIILSAAHGQPPMNPPLHKAKEVKLA